MLERDQHEEREPNQPLQATPNCGAPERQAFGCKWFACYPCGEVTVMASKLEDVEQAALELPVKERARLVTRLVASLEADVDEEVELAWAEETERRYQEALADPSATEPAAQAFQRARDALR